MISDKIFIILISLPLHKLQRKSQSGPHDGLWQRHVIKHILISRHFESSQDPRDYGLLLLHRKLLANAVTGSRTERNVAVGVSLCDLLIRKSLGIIDFVVGESTRIVLHEGRRDEHGATGRQDHAFFCKHLNASRNEKGAKAPGKRKGLL